MAKSLVEELKQLITDNHWELVERTPTTQSDKICISVLESDPSAYDEYSSRIDYDSIDCTIIDLWQGDKTFACIRLVDYQQFDDRITDKHDYNDKAVEEQKLNSTMINLLDEQHKAQIVAIIRLLLDYSDANILVYMYYATNEVRIVMPHNICALEIKIEFMNWLMNPKESLSCDITYSLLPVSSYDPVTHLNTPAIFTGRNSVFERMAGALQDVCKTNKLTLGIVPNDNLYRHLNVVKEEDSILQTLMTIQQHAQQHYREYTENPYMAQQQYSGTVSCVGDILMLIDNLSTAYGRSSIYGMLMVVAMVTNKCYRTGYQVEKLVYPRVLLAGCKLAHTSSAIQTIYFRIYGSRLFDNINGKQVPRDPVPLIDPVDILITYDMVTAPNLYIIQNRRVLSYIRQADFLDVDQAAADICKFIGLV